MSNVVLYSFRRCPYAIAARISMALSKTNYFHREISLKDKPAELLNLSPKGTVPVLVMGDIVIDESADIVNLMSRRADIPVYSDREGKGLIEKLLQSFLPAMHKYKYEYLASPDERVIAMAQITQILSEWNDKLHQSKFILSDEMSDCDIRMYPLIWQCQKIDPIWFQEQNLAALNRWMLFWREFLETTDIMRKFPLWDNQSQGEWVVNDHR
jgi:glutathione S-transferase